MFVNFVFDKGSQRRPQLTNRQGVTWYVILLGALSLAFICACSLFVFVFVNIFVFISICVNLLDMYFLPALELDSKEKQLEHQHSCNKRLTRCTLNSWPIVWELFNLSDRLVVFYLPKSIKLLASSGAPFVTNREIIKVLADLLRAFLSVWSSDSFVCLILSKSVKMVWSLFIEVQRLHIDTGLRSWWEASCHHDIKCCNFE